MKLTVKVEPAKVVVPILTETGPVRVPGLTIAVMVESVTPTTCASTPLMATVGAPRLKPSPSMVIVVPIPPVVGVTFATEKPTHEVTKEPWFSS
ncbi:hypothetical protein D3C86_1604400 [compost metagenome]